MNNEHKAFLADLKDSIDAEFGEEAVWLSSNGHTDVVFGTFSLTDKSFKAKSQGKNKQGEITLDVVTATYAMKPDKVKIKEGDRLMINGQTFFVLPFNTGDFETIIPLKLTQNKNHNWR